LLSIKCVMFSLQPRTTSLLNGLSSHNAHNARQLSAVWDVDQTCKYYLQCNRFMLPWNSIYI